MARQLCLASASPRRAELLAQIGLTFDVQVADINETPQQGEGALAYVERMALEKARAVQRMPRWAQQYVLGSDTSVVIDGEILGKPEDRADGLAMLARLSGRTHEVYTSVALVHETRALVRVSINRVSFRQISVLEAQAYWSTGEPHDKAGCYAVQGKAAVFISHLEGSFSGVMGLPLYETAELLNEFSLDVKQTWAEH